MNRILTVLTIFFLLSFTALAQNTLKIEITNLKNNSGVVALDLRDSNDKSVKYVFGEINNKKCTIIIKNLKPGTYAFRYFHDENSNKEMDTNWVGIPVEGYGFSNNAKGYFGPPDFKDTTFEVKNNTQVTCKAYYINL